MLLVWALCWLVWAGFLYKYADSMPWCDDYGFVSAGIATHEAPVTWAFLWAGNNEHRHPLTKLWVIGLGRALGWDFWWMRQANVAVLALSVLPLIFAVRAMRGRSSWFDVALPLLLLTSAQVESLYSYVYSYSTVLAVWSVMAAALVVKWPQRSWGHLLAYSCGALCVTWGGGPPGNFWAIGLCAPLISGWFQPKTWRWKLLSILFAAAILGSTLAMFWFLPRMDQSDYAGFRSDSLGLTVLATAKASIAWMGFYFCPFIWPWGVAAILLPLLYLMGAIVRDSWRRPRAAFLAWFDYLLLFVATAVVFAAIGYGRARIPATLWESRYVTMVLPCVVTMYLMLARARTPRPLLLAWTVWLVVVVGFNWRDNITIAGPRHAQQVRFVAELQKGREPLSVLAERYVDVMGFWSECIWVRELPGWLHQMRKGGLAVFAPAFGSDSDPEKRCLFWRSDAGSMNRALRVADDPTAMSNRTVLADTNDAQCEYDIMVPATSAYKLCCRWKVPAPGRSFSVAVENRPAIQQSVPVSERHSACVLREVVPFEAGKHRLTITWPGPGSSLDLLELTPECGQLPGAGGGNPKPIYEGNFEKATDVALVGWAWDSTRPDEPITIEVFDGLTKVASIVADQFRADLRNAGKGSGKHGFLLPLPTQLKDGKTHTLSIRPANSDTAPGPAQTVTSPTTN